MYVYAVYVYHKYKYTYIYTAIFVDIELHNETLFEKKIGIKIQQNHISVIRFRSRYICIIGVSYIEPISSFNMLEPKCQIFFVLFKKKKKKMEDYESSQPKKIIIIVMETTRNYSKNAKIYNVFCCVHFS